MKNVSNDYDGYQKMIDFYNLYKDETFMEVSLSIDVWFSANMCSALGGIFELLLDNLNSLKLQITPKTEEVLKKNNFLSYYGQSSLQDNFHTTIPYQKLKPTDGKFFKEYIFNNLLSRKELPNMSQGVKGNIAEAIYEIFTNAQIHSESPYIFTCGQFYPSTNKIVFTITDIGVGFKHKINKRFNATLNSEQAIKWAVQDKHTVKEGVPGGIGLAFLKEFVAKNKGQMQIISNEGFYQYDINNELTKTFSGEFPGSIVNLQFNTADDNSYLLTEEIDLKNIF